ncbi:hypothetical protein SEUCBS140593_006893 [Sporothrix eucalyptigena]|uniref:Acyltransferase 3 domain-containing protein n=1 Tax=Sporothrix eucalyptigena TaxID=1812306 RepID=A0ABP0C8L6_9PEZI
MAPNATRQWAVQPAYNQVPTEDTIDEKKMEETEKTTIEEHPGSGSGSSSRSSNPDIDAEADAGFPTLREKRRFPGTSLPTTGLAGAVFALPLLALRIAYLCWLLVTRPVRHLFGSHGASSKTATSSSSTWPAIYQRMGEFRVLVPSFLQPVDPSVNASARKMHPTAWLDGMRGMGAFFVVWNHSTVMWFGWHIHNGWGINENEHWLVQLPIIRIFISGPPQVAIFFVISGYALSYKPLKLSRMGRFAEAYEAIASSAFRRWPRLFFMPIVITFITALMTYLDLFGTEGWGGVAIPSRRPPRDGTLWGQMVHWWPSVVALTDPFSKNMDRGGRYAYDKYLWTLPVEFECSMMLFMCQLCFNRLRPNVRIVFMFCLASFCMKYIYWQYFLFLTGMIVCDIQLGLQNQGNKVSSAGSATIPISRGPLGAVFNIYSSFRRFIARHALAVGIFFFFVSLWILSVPEAIRGAVGSPGFVTMIKMVPEHHKTSKKTDYFWVPIGAALIVYTVDRTPALQKMFTHWFPQYIGKISYSLYLVHGGIIFSVGHWAVRHTVGWTGNDTQLRYGLGLALSAIPLWITLIFCADLATRTLDKWSLSLGRLLYERLSIEEPKPEPVLPRTN